MTGQILLWLLLGIIVVVTILQIWKIQFGAVAEPFESAQAIVNNIDAPVARDINPTKKAFAEIGISAEKADDIKDTFRKAFNLPDISYLNDGSRGLEMVPEVQQNTARVDDENSFLGTVAFCAKQGAKADPFSDPKFAQTCGMCMTKGKLLTGESFVSPTGVVVFPADREKALKDMNSNGYPFPRVLPSMKAATCEGASVGDDARPSMALNAQQYMQYKGRAECQKSRVVGEKGCGQCFNTSSYTYVDSGAGVEPIQLTVYGLGDLIVKVRGAPLDGGAGAKPISLSLSTPAVVDLKRLKEGERFTLDVSQGSTNGPKVGGFFSSALANGSKFQMPLENLALVDTKTGAAPRRTGFFYSPEYGSKLVVLSAAAGSSALSVEVAMPFTFLESDELGAYDCPNAPIMKLKESAAQLSTDPCTRGAPGSYSAECLQQRVLDAGCTQAGDAYKNAKGEAGSLGISEFVDKILRYANMKEVDRDAARKCVGAGAAAALTTPCDAFLGAGAGGSSASLQQCLSFLYTNQSEGTPVGKAYSSVPSLAYTSVQGTTGKPSYCLAQGTLNPANSKELEGVFTNGYKSLKGVEAVKRFLSDVFMRATDDTLAPTISDAAGGRATSIARCFKSVAAFPEYGVLGAAEYTKLYRGAAATNPVVVLGPLGMAPWSGGWGIRADSLPDRNAKWIWSKEGAEKNEPSWQTYRFMKKFRNTTSAPIRADLTCIVDNRGTLEINNTNIGSLGGVTRHSVTFPVGESLVVMACANQGGPAGMAMTAVNAATKAVLFSSDGSWTFE
jgi:hypothetical protein